MTITKIPPVSAGNPLQLADQLNHTVNRIIQEFPIPEATATTPGLITATEKVKLDGISPGGAPPMWIKSSSMQMNNILLGSGVTANNPYGYPVGSVIGVGIRAAWTSHTGNQHTSEYLNILPSVPGNWNNNNSLQNMTYFSVTTLQWIDFTDGGPTGQNGWRIDLGQYGNNNQGLYWAWQM